MVDLDAWIEWLRSLDTGWYFLFVLPLVVVVVVLWSRSLKSDKTKHYGSE